MGDELVALVPAPDARLHQRIVQRLTDQVSKRMAVRVREQVRGEMAPQRVEVGGVDGTVRTQGDQGTSRVGVGLLAVLSVDQPEAVRGRCAGASVRPEGRGPARQRPTQTGRPRDRLHAERQRRARCPPERTGSEPLQTWAGSYWSIGGRRRSRRSPSIASMSEQQLVRLPCFGERPPASRQFTTGFTTAQSRMSARSSCVAVVSGTHANEGAHRPLRHMRRRVSAGCRRSRGRRVSPGRRRGHRLASSAPPHHA